MYALIDVNAFYAACETVFRPDLRGRPVVVLSNNDGCVIARSAEAKKLDIKMGMPYFQIRDLIRQHRVQVFSSNYALYADMSLRVMTILEEMAPTVEIYSIDEAFIDISGISSCMSLDQFGRDVRARVQKETHLTVSVGIAPTKTLAKLANHAAKKWHKTGGVLDLSDAERQRKLMGLLPVGEVWGVGQRLSKKLNLLGIETARDLSQCPTWFIRKNFNVVLERTVRELRGESCLELSASVPAKQQIVCSRSFGHRITGYEEMRQAICTYAERAAEKLRGEKQYCRLISVFMKTNPHAADEVYYGNQITGKLLTPSNDTRDIIRVAMDCLARIWIDGHRYMKAGVMLGDFFSQGVAQLNLFDDFKPNANSESLMRVIDSINHSGRGHLWFAGQGTQKSWAMKRERLSPAYTTRYSDLPVVR